jgi:hypothetical protein
MLGDVDLLWLAAQRPGTTRDPPRRDQAEKLPRRPSSGRLHDLHAPDAGGKAGGKAAASPLPGWLRRARTSSDSFS